MWFDRGLAMCFGFNHEEAVRCFEKAHKADPSLAIALWGMAYAWGPNINNLEIEAHQIAQAAACLRLAELNTSKTTKLERALIKALAQRYAVPVPADRRPLNEAYANAMRKVYQQCPDDPLVAALFAESRMNLRPWKHWTPEGQPAPETPGIVAVLEKAQKRSPDHPALCHLYIHTMEASPTPEKALPAANALRDRMPGLGHLLHMPSHIDILVTNYDEPWGWMQPARHALGALLLGQGRVAEAESVYRADLRRHPKNVWALQGLTECLERQDKTMLAAEIRTQFDLAAARADVPVDRSCFCRLNVTEPGK